MDKELEALKIGIPKLKKLYENSAKKMSQNDILGFDLVFVYLDKVLQHLESIENSSPSEALEKLLDGYSKGMAGRSYYDIIKQYILKAQEMEKVIVELCEYCGMDNLYPYDNLNEIEIAFKNTFDNYQRQRIESLGRLNKQGKVLKIIKEKPLSIVIFKMFKIYDKKEVLELDYQSFVDCHKAISEELDKEVQEQVATPEEFNLLKRYYNEKNL